VFGVRKRFLSLSSEPQSEQPSQEGLPCEVSDEVRNIAIRCGEALGLGLYGLDVLETESGPKVVDLNAFPSYRGAVEAAPLITNYISACASGEINFSSAMNLVNASALPKPVSCCPLTRR
jgi:RimK-like ATP-grasp domain